MQDEFVNSLSDYKLPFRCKLLSLFPNAINLISGTCECSWSQQTLPWVKLATHLSFPGGKIFPNIPSWRNISEYYMICDQAFLPMLPLWNGAHQVGVLQWQVPHPEPGREGHGELHKRSQDAVSLQGEPILSSEDLGKIYRWENFPNRRMLPCKKKPFISTRNPQWDNLYITLLRYIKNIKHRKSAKLPWHQNF